MKMDFANAIRAATKLTRAQKLMEELDISASRRVRGLGAKQLEMLLDRFAKR